MPRTPIEEQEYQQLKYLADLELAESISFRPAHRPFQPKRAGYAGMKVIPQKVGQALEAVGRGLGESQYVQPIEGRGLAGDISNISAQFTRLAGQFASIPFTGAGQLLQGKQETVQIPETGEALSELKDVADTESWFKAITKYGLDTVIREAVSIGIKIPQPVLNLVAGLIKLPPMLRKGKIVEPVKLTEPSQMARTDVEFPERPIYTPPPPKGRPKTIEPLTEEEIIRADMDIAAFQVQEAIKPSRELLEKQPQKIVVGKEELKLKRELEPRLKLIKDAENRGIQFKDLSPEEQKIAKSNYQKETGDLDVAERGWESYGYNPKTFKIMGDDPIYSAEAEQLGIGKYSKRELGAKVELTPEEVAKAKAKLLEQAEAFPVRREMPKGFIRQKPSELTPEEQLGEFVQKPKRVEPELFGKEGKFSATQPTAIGERFVADNDWQIFGQEPKQVQSAIDFLGSESGIKYRDIIDKRLPGENLRKAQGRFFKSAVSKIARQEMEAGRNSFEAVSKRLSPLRKWGYETALGTEPTIDPITGAIRGGTTLYTGIPVQEVKQAVKATGEWVNEKTKPLQFYPDAPPELRNAIRTDLIGGVHKILSEWENNAKELYHGLKDTERQQVVEIANARDAIARIEKGVGVPDENFAVVKENMLTDAKKNLQTILAETKNPEVLKRAELWKQKATAMRQDLIERGKLDPNQGFEDYIRHYVEDYTPDWSPVVNVPTKLRKQFRGYTKKAVGTTKEHRVTPEILPDALAEVTHDNLLDDFIKAQSEKYNVIKTLSAEEKAKLRGDAEFRRFKINDQWVTIDPLNYLRPGRIYDIAGKRYRVYSPDKPYSRQLYPVEVELVDGSTKTVMAMGGFKKTYLVPENVYQTFETFSEKGGGSLMYAINRVTSYFKTSAILSRFISFHRNNIAGDLFMKLFTHPKKTEFIRYFDDGLKWLLTKKEKWTPEQTEFAKWMGDQAVLDAVFVNELPHIHKTANPVLWVLQKSQRFSKFRENILRVADANWLWDELKAGRGEQTRKLYDWIPTEGLTTEQALGKIARESAVGDYGAVSKTFARYVRGFAAPFGTWYAKLSSQTWNYLKKHPLKAVAGLLFLPTVSTVWNNRSKEVRDMWMSLPEDLRSNSFLLVLGETADKKVKTFTFQTPQDALIGTKIFGVAVSQLNAVLNGAKTPQQAALDTIKRWGIKEARGIEFILNPLVRYMHGLAEGRDPTDRQSVYPIDQSKLSAEQRWMYRGLYFFKVAVPFLGAYISEEQGAVRPKNQVVKELIDKWGGLPALGIYDFTPQGRLSLPNGEELDWEDYRDMREKDGKIQMIINGIADEFVKSGVSPVEFYQSKEFKERLIKLTEIYGKIPPPEVQESLSESIRGQIEEDIDVAVGWLYNKVDASKTDQEKRYWTEKLDKAKRLRMATKFKQLPKRTIPLLEEELTQ